MQPDRRRETCRGDTLSYSVALNTPTLTRPLLMQLADSERPAASTLAKSSRRAGGFRFRSGDPRRRKCPVVAGAYDFQTRAVRDRRRDEELRMFYSVPVRGAANWRKYRCRFRAGCAAPKWA
jgi:hypothetical protein